MYHSEFEDQMRRLKLTYGEKNFPDEREKMMFRRYEKYPKNAFESAVDMAVLQMPNAGTIIGFLDGQLENAFKRTQLHLGQAEIDRLHPIQPNAKELAAKYGGEILAMLRGSRTIGRPLPYDPSVRINSESEVPF